MKKSNSELSRRKFMLMSSAAIASPLLLKMTNKVSEAKAAESTSKKPKNIYFINRTCIGCQVCRTFCPVQAIHYGDCANEIDQKKCIHCGTCYRECPISVISQTEL